MGTAACEPACFHISRFADRTDARISDSIWASRAASAILDVVKKFLTLALFAGILAAADAPVTVAQDNAVFTLANSWLTAQVNKTTGNLVSLKFRGIETMGFVSGAHAGYWEQNPAKAPRLSATLTIDPSANGGERAEVSVKGISEGHPLDGGGQPGGAMLCDLEIRYSLG